LGWLNTSVQKGTLREEKNPHYNKGGFSRMRKLEEKSREGGGQNVAMKK